MAKLCPCSGAIAFMAKRVAMATPKKKKLNE